MVCWRGAFRMWPSIQRVGVTWHYVSVPYAPPPQHHPIGLSFRFFCVLKCSSLWVPCHQIQICRQFLRHFIANTIISSLVLMINSCVEISQNVSAFHWLVSSCSCKVLALFYLKISLKKKHGSHKILYRKGSLAITQESYFFLLSVWHDDTQRSKLHCCVRTWWAPSSGSTPAV